MSILIFIMQNSFTYKCTKLFPSLCPINLQDNRYKHVFTSRMENSVDPYQLEASLSRSTLFSKRNIFGFMKVRVYAL